MDKDSIAELAIQYATEGLDPQAETQMNEWLAIASSEDKLHFAETVDMCAEMHAAASPTMQISQKSKSSLIEQINTEHSHPHEEGEVLMLPQDQQEWITLPIKGSRLLELSARKKDGFTMAIIEIEPNTEFPAHEHHGVEMAYILEGDLEADGILLKAGDFFRADAGTHHGTHFSPSGCRALMVTSSENYKHNTMKVLGGMQKLFRRCKALLGK